MVMWCINQRRVPMGAKWVPTGCQWVPTGCHCGAMHTGVLVVLISVKSVRLLALLLRCTARLAVGMGTLSPLAAGSDSNVMLPQNRRV